MIESFPFIIVAFGDNEKEAWKKFDIKFKYYSEYIKGYKYWRVTPTYEVSNRWDTKDIEHTVTARLISCKTKIKGLTQASVKKPYPEKIVCGAKFELRAYGLKLNEK